MSTQFYWDFDFDAGFESDQEFESKNYTFGAHFALEVKAWNDRSTLGMLNVLDYPAALIRVLTGFDKELRPRGSAIPTVLLRLDHVGTDGDGPRAMVGDKSSYLRFRSEIVYKSPIAQIGGKQYSVVASYRSFHEVSPSRAVRRTGLDNYNYLALVFESNEGLFASFPSGRQPFDEGNSDAYQLGWKVDF